MSSTEIQKNKHEYPGESRDLPVAKLLKDATVAALIAVVLFFHLIGLRTVDQPTGLGLSPQWLQFAVLVGSVFVGRILFGLIIFEREKSASSRRKPGSSLSFPWIPAFAGMRPYVLYNYIILGLFILTLVLPFTPFASRYVLDVITLILTYVILAYGLSIVVGMTGLLDLGFVAYYAIGAYCFALLAKYQGFSFWEALPIAMLLAALVSGILGMIVLRLRGDYYAVVTLGFAEILRITILNWVSFTGGPNGITGVPRPTFFGFTFTPAERVMYLYYLALAFAVLIYFFLARLKCLPIGRAFEAVREDERAAEALGINLTRTKLAATMLAAAMGALAGAFFATRQGFISPESFTFTESALVLAIVVLAGSGHAIGVVLAAIFLVGLPEIFRDLQDYRMIAFGAGMVLIMVLRPQGLFSRREPSLRVANAKSDVH